MYAPIYSHNGQLFGWNVTLPHGYFSAPPENRDQVNGMSILTPWQTAPSAYLSLCLRTNIALPDEYWACA